MDAARELTRADDGQGGRERAAEPARQPGAEVRSPASYAPGPVPLSLYRDIRVGLVANVNAGANRHGRYDSATYRTLVGRMGLVRESHDVMQLGDIIAEFQQRGINTILVNGGDGTFGSVVTEVIHQWQGGLPAFVPLRGGTLNATAKTLGAGRSPAAIVSSFVEQVRARRGAIHQRWIRTLCVTDPLRPRCHHGFIFGNGICYEYERYIEQHGGTSKLNDLRLSLWLTLQAALHTRTATTVWRDMTADVRISGRPVDLPRYQIAIATAIDGLPWFVRPCPPAPPVEAGRFSYMISGVERAQALRHPLAILRGRYRSPLHLTGTCESMCIRHTGGYMLDGELWPEREDTPLTLSAGPPIRVWTPTRRLGARR